MFLGFIGVTLVTVVLLLCEAEELKNSNGSLALNAGFPLGLGGIAGGVLALFTEAGGCTFY